MKKRNEMIGIVLALVMVGMLFLWGKEFTSKINPNDNKMKNDNTDINNSAKEGDMVTINYVGTLKNGVKFDSSIDRGQPLEVVLGSGQVIKGFDNGVLGMKVGEKKRIVVSPEEGYGSVSTESIPPNSTLIFDVELLGITPASK